MDITELLLKRFAPQKQEIGKFNASSIYGITHRYTNIEEYLNGKQFSFIEAFRCWNGTAKHNQIQELFEGLEEYEIEKRAEYKYKDFVVVGKADLLTKDQIIEIKTSQDLMSEAKPWALYQCKIYCSLFDRTKGIIVQPIIKGSSIELKELGVVEKDDKFFQKELVKLENFHKQVLEYVKEKENKKTKTDKESR